MKEYYDNDSVRRTRIREIDRPVIDSISKRVAIDSPAEARSYTLLELLPRNFITIEKKKVVRSVT